MASPGRIVEGTVAGAEGAVLPSLIFLHLPDICDDFMGLGWGLGGEIMGDLNVRSIDSSDHAQNTGNCSVFPLYNTVCCRWMFYLTRCDKHASMTKPLVTSRCCLQRFVTLYNLIDSAEGYCTYISGIRRAVTSLDALGEHAQNTVMYSVFDFARHTTIWCWR